MSRAFIVVGETRAIMTNLDNFFIEIDEANRRGFRGSDVDVGFAKDRIERILREDMLDICDEQFLVLLLMMNAENQNRFNLIEKLFVSIGKKIGDVRIDRRAIAPRFFYGGARDQTPQIAPVHVTGRIIIGIEEVGVLRNFRAINRKEFFQDKRLEKPGGMGKVPFGRADVRHRLYDTIFGLEIRAESCREFSGFAKPREQTFGTRWTSVRTRTNGRGFADCGRGD